MLILEKKLGCALLLPQILHDSRGWFKVALNLAELQRFNLQFQNIYQLNHSMTELAGTVRGLNFQESPYEQAKIIRCINGSLYSVAVDIRKESEFYGHWCGFNLDAESGKLMYIPRGYAHGFVVNEDKTELEYFTDNVYSKEHAKSIRYDDPDIGIDWSQNGQIKILKDVLSEKNRNAISLSEYKNT